MAYYFAALPVVYFSTQFAASKAMNAAATWATVCEELKDDSAPTIDAAKSIVKLYNGLSINHPAYVTLKHLQISLDQLKYVSSKANQSKQKWRLLLKDFSKINTKIQTHCSRVERRIRLFNEIMMSASLQKGLKC